MSLSDGLVDEWARAESFSLEGVGVRERVGVVVPLLAGEVEGEEEVTESLRETARRRRSFKAIVCMYDFVIKIV